MQKDKFEEIPAGTVIRFPGYKGSFAKAFVCVENDDEDGSYWFSDGKNTVIDCESTPEKVCILKNEYLYVPEPENYTNSKEWCSWIEGNRNKLRELDQKAKKDGKLLGRMVRFQYADGYAYTKSLKYKKIKFVFFMSQDLGMIGIIREWQMAIFTTVNLQKSRSGTEMCLMKNLRKENKFEKSSRRNFS